MLNCITSGRFERCISTLKTITIIAKLPEDQRSAKQSRRVQRFEEFGCATCYKVTPGEMGLTQTGTKLARLHLGCVEVLVSLGGVLVDGPSLTTLRHRARVLAQQLEVRMILIDEVHSILSGTAREQRVILNSISIPGE